MLENRTGTSKSPSEVVFIVAGPCCHNGGGGTVA